MCSRCARNLHGACNRGGCNECHPTQDKIETSETTPNDDETEEEVIQLERSGKLDSSLVDPQSTGRKRAAKLYPLDKTKPCEWREVLHAGGGLHPIMGCVDGKQQARHHGPDYNTLNNDPGNVHRICHRCHNVWHVNNDPDKNEAYLKLYGTDVSAEALSKAAKDLKSGGYQSNKSGL
jgi:hypothetical protein